MQRENHQHRCIHHILESWALNKSDSIALTYRERYLSYGELNRRANQLAYYLHKQGVGPEVPVGMCVERSLELIVGILGILKAGGAYVPLDPAYPKERLAFMIQDAQMPVLLTQKHLVDRLPIQSAQVVCLDTSWTAIAQESAENLSNRVMADNLAYIMYTSGSTGRPKGVCCNHAGVVNLLADFQRRKPLALGDQCSLWTSINFDVSIYEIFSAFLSGGTLHIVPDDRRIDSNAFFDWLRVHKISSAYIPPFMFADLSNWLNQEREKLYLQRLLVGVEPIQEQLLVSLIQRIPGLCIINGYGPTEATICATLYSVGSQLAQHRRTPIGRPIQRATVYLLDGFLRPVPIGVPGEVYIGGVGLARCYLNCPGLTAECFIPNLFSKEPGARLYKTGDIARYLSTGDIEFLGRRDNQVKLRGHRIELGEVETVLSQHPAVREYMVLLRDNSSGDKHLVAYITHHPLELWWNQQITELTDNPPQDVIVRTLVSHLRHFMQGKLPDYMLPSAVMLLDKFPLTPNGKVDLSALPAPDWGRSEDGNAPVVPRTPTEELLASIWAEVLAIEEVGIHDNFFDLGGHSLLATQLISRVRTAFQIDHLPLRSLFEAPTIALLAARIEASNNGVQFQK